MINNLNDYLRGIAVGIRFRPSFSLEDKLGEIIDEILYKDNSFFNPNVFPETERSVGQRSLINRETNDSLIIDHQNVIMEIYFDEEFTFSREDMPNLLNKFEEEIINKILKKNNVEDIVRIGYIQRFIFEDEELTKQFISKTIRNAAPSVNEINLRFASKLSTMDSLAKKEVNDYDNAIFNVRKFGNKKELLIALDYQSFYDPPISDVSEIKFKDFIDKATNFNNKKLLPWINNYSEDE